jgi:heme/copper-type cytochrome/quinol oxidase subunit 4
MPKEAKKSCLASSIIAFTLAVCCVVLNSHTDEIKCNEESVKKRYIVFLVSIISSVIVFMMQY